MDGNGRWAKSRGRPRTFGHIKGTRQAKKIIEESARLHLKHLTLYAFSAENWSRPESEIAFLMRILHRYIQKEKATLMKQNIRFETLGRIGRLPVAVSVALEDLKETTKKNTGMRLSLALSYGGRQDIVDAAIKTFELIESGKIKKEEVNETLFSSQLETRGLPDPDLIIRTSGEYRLSNFMMWQCAYSELYVTPTLWPDFTENDLHLAILNYSKRQRRFGLTGDQLEPQFRNQMDIQ